MKVPQSVCRGFDWEQNLLADSCGRCDGWDDVPANQEACSCEVDCGLTGTCCVDAAQYCDVKDGEVDPADASTALMDGEQWFVWTPPIRSVSQNARYFARKLIAADGATTGSESFAGLLKFGTSELLSDTELARCTVEEDRPHPEGPNGPTRLPFWMLTAYTQSGSEDKAEVDADCVAMAVKFPKNLPAGSRPTLTGEVFGSAATDGTQSMRRSLGVPTSAWATEFPFLTDVQFLELHDGTEWASCDIRDPDVSGTYQLEIVGEGDSGARCGARVLHLGTSGLRRASCPPPESRNYVAVGGLRYSNCWNDPVDGGPGAFYVSANGSSLCPHGVCETSVQLYPTATHACFLTHVRMEDVDDGDETTYCEIRSEFGETASDPHGQDYWVLRTKATQDEKVRCKAVCLEFPDNQYRRPVPTHVPTYLGAELTLVKTGAYDKPLVIVEGYDPANQGHFEDFYRSHAALFRAAAKAGIDVWHLSASDGGQEILKTAREVAEAIDIAYKHELWQVSHPGKRIALVGFSMGGLASRVALASWEAGFYNCASGLGECISPGLGDSTTRPPVATFVAVNGPQLGAVIPVSLQETVQDVVNQWSPGALVAYINSAAAENMLYTRIDNRCGWDIPCGQTPVTEHCLNTDTLDAGLHYLDGSTCAPYSSSGCVQWIADEDPWSCAGDYCNFQVATHDTFYAQVNARNVNGMPHQVATMGLSNGSFSLPDYSWGNELARLYFNDWGKACAYCERQSDFRLLFSSPRADRPNLEWLPGDTWPTPIDQILGGIVPVPKHVIEFTPTQNFKFTFVPTESALFCQGKPSLETCRTTTRFMKIASNPDNKNGPHTELHGVLAAQGMAFLADAFADGDGYCTPQTPFALPTESCVGANDCDDTRADVHPGAPEICDHRDNDCDGVIDEGCPPPGGGCSGPGGTCVPQEME